MTLKELRSIGRYPLLKPMIFVESFSEEDNIWFLENEELSIIGGGNSEAEIIKSLEEHLEGYIHSYLRFTPEELSDESIKLHERLKEYLDFNQASKILSEKYADEDSADDST